MTMRPNALFAVTTIAVGRRSAPHSTDTAVAVTPGAVWFVTSTGELVRVDPGTNRVVRRVPLGEAAQALAIAPDGSVWVAAEQP